MQKFPVYIFDIDGTLADCAHRLHFVKGKKRDYRAFFAAVADDTPIPHMVRLCLDLLCNSDISVIFVSGRSSECEAATRRWLLDHVTHSLPTTVRCGAMVLYMREAGDTRPDNVVKLELLARIRKDGWEPVMAFDDRRQVVDMWRANGVPCAQVAEGEF